MSISPPQSSEYCPDCSTTLTPFFTFCPSCGCKLSRPVTEPAGSTHTPIPGGISIQRNEQVFGPYPRDVVEQWIASGQVRKYDLGCRDLLEGWQPLGKILWPHEFSKAGTFTRKQWTWIIFAIVGFVIVISIVNALDSNRGSSSAETSSQQTKQIAKSLTDFERGKQYFENGSYLAARDVLSGIQKTDPNYAEAQAKLKLAAEKIEEQERELKKKDSVRKQYEKLCHSGLYLHEIEQRLQRDNFQMDDSKFEKAPDGSTGVRQYFSKTTSDGFVVKIWLQSAYALGYHYCDVRVE